MKIENWAIVSGKFVSQSGGEFTYTCPLNPDGSPSDEIKSDTTNLRADAQFSNGTIKLRFKTDNSKTGVLIKLQKNTPTEQYLLVGHSRNHEAFVIMDEFLPPDKKPVRAGSLKNYDLATHHELRVEVDGSDIKLFVDDVLMCSANEELKEGFVMLKLASHGTVKASDFEIDRKQQKAFIVMQFSSEYNDIYEEVIRPVCSEHNILAVRADEYYSSTPILADIVRSIRECSIIIAEITPDNPNVFYEIGYSHAIGKPVILLANKDRTKLPFDLSSFRTIFYENTISGKKKIENSLKKYLSTML